MVIMKKKTLIKNIVFVVIGLFILIMGGKLFEYTHLLVGISMIIFSIDELINQVIEKELFTKHSQLPLITLQTLLGALTIVRGSTSLDFVCIIWATWTFMREAMEIKERVVGEFKKPLKVVPFLNLAESLVVIFFSALLMFELEEGILVHIYILGAEFILEFVWYLLEKLGNKKKAE